MAVFCLYFFFFQAEDGIRDGRVTGVQTCALPISEGAADRRLVAKGAWRRPRDLNRRMRHSPAMSRPRFQIRSEERRVGKECRARWSPTHEKKKLEIQVDIQKIMICKKRHEIAYMV